jgi:hypothetical protein
MTADFIPQNVVDFARSQFTLFQQFVYHEINDDLMRLRVRMLLAHECEKHLIEYQYNVVCDATNNPPSVIDNRDLVADVAIRNQDFEGSITFSNAGVHIQGWKP